MRHLASLTINARPAAVALAALLDGVPRARVTRYLFVVTMLDAGLDPFRANPFTE